MKELILLTSPNFLGYLKLFVKYLLKGKFYFYQGNRAVTKSLCKGLKQNKIPYDYPFIINQKYKTGIALAGQQTVDKLIYLKKKGRVQKIFVGPNVNLATTPKYRTYLKNKHIDFFIVPSEWYKQFLLNFEPNIQNKIIVWAAGININKFKPHTKEKIENKILIYRKDIGGITQLNNKRIQQIKSNTNYIYDEIHYGNYTQKEFLEKLNSCVVMIYLSASESQGIALLETWAMNVPTLVMNYKNAYWDNIQMKNSEVAPYLTTHTGMYFENIKDLNNLIPKCKKLNPRKWVLTHMSDKICAKKLYKILNL